MVLVKHNIPTEIFIRENTNKVIKTVKVYTSIFAAAFMMESGKIVSCTVSAYLIG
jgi:hypothetical protein